MNFCRQLLVQLQKQPRIKNVEPSEQGLDIEARVVKSMLDGAVKFLLPDGGILLDDSSFTALDPTKFLRLPFEKIVLEYTNSENNGKPVEPDPTGDPRLRLMCPTKRILFASEVSISNAIVCQPFFYFPAHNGWVCMDPFIIPCLNYLADGPDGMKSFMTVSNNPGRNEYVNGVPLLSLLNALACTNVRTESFTTAKTSTKRVKTKGALPFDEYKILTIGRGESRGSYVGHGGIHRSPREHLRRGHIRRLHSGACTWVNATVVAAGSGSRIIKDYAIRA